MSGQNLPPGIGNDPQGGGGRPAAQIFAGAQTSRGDRAAEKAQ